VAVFSRRNGNNRAQRRDIARDLRRNFDLPTGTTLSTFINAANAATSALYSAPRSLTAAAAQIKLNDKGEAEQFRSRRLAGANAWQQEAWEYYDAIGEIKYAFNLVASVVSRIRLYAAVVQNPA